MQIKTINKTIATKLNEWLDTINDETLRKKIKENLLVSGGCIVSLFTNEEVNDYDIYIKDIQVLNEIASYYTKDYPEITVLNGADKANISEQFIGEHNGIDAEDYNTAYGICVRNLKPEQVKLWIYQGNLRVNEDKNESELNYEPIFFSPNAISLSNKLQIVLRFHGDNEAIHKNFDFIHATNYFTFENGLVCNVEALQSIMTKQLKYQGSLYPLTSIIRMKKFIKRGWNIGAGEILKIMFQISELDLKNPDVLEEQLIGVDVAYFGMLIEILRGVDKEEITSHWLNTVIDRVFNKSDSEL